MRILTLALEAYGGFADRSIGMRSDAHLTVVHGRNEGGKSTALHALADLLYGVETRSDYGWRHGLKNMSVAGVLLRGDGDRIAVRRLKRQSRTLVDMANQPLPDDTLEVFLQGRTRAQFEDGFGLNQARLRAGGKRLLQGGGDLADTLVAAAPGLSNVLALREKLNAEAAKFHSHQRKSSSTAFAMASAERDAARSAIRDSEVRADAVKSVRQELDDAALARKAAVEAEATARMEVARLDRLQRAAVDLGALDRLSAARVALEPVPALDPDALVTARAIVQAIADARRLHAACREELGAAEAALAAIAVDGASLDAAAAVEALDERRAVVAHALEDVPKRQDEVATTRGTIARLSAALGLRDTDEMSARLPGDPMLARADRLVDRMRSVETARVEAADSHVRLKGASAKSQAELARIGDAPDPGALRRRLESLDGCEERAEAAKRAKGSSAAEANRLDALVARLALGANDLATLSSLHLPSVARAVALAKKVADAEGDLGRAAQAETSTVDQEARCRARLDAIKAPGSIPTPAAVEAVRRIRDATWAKLRPALMAERAVVDEDARAASVLDEAIPDADRLADERWAGSARATDLLHAEVALGEAAADVHSAKVRKAERRRSLDEARAAWDGLWFDAAVASSEPSDLVERLRQAHDALSQGDSLARLREDEASRVARSDADGRHVAQIAHDLDLPASHASVSDIRAAIATMDTRFRERRDVERDLRNVEHASGDLAARLRAIDDEAASVGREAAEVLPALNVRPDAASAEAKAALAAWRDARSALPALEQLLHRLGRIQETKATFEADAEAVLRAVAPDMEDGPFVGIRRLRTRVEAARRADSRAADARLSLAKRKAACDRSASALQGRVCDLHALMARLGASTEPEVGPSLDRAERALAVEAETLQVRARLDEALAGYSEAEARADLGSRDALTLVGLRSTAEALAGAASVDVAAAIERHVLARSAVTAVETRAGAAAAAQDEQDAISAMAAAAEGFVRNHVAGRLLATAIDRYRERHQSPIIARASDGFAGLTSGQWEGIGIDYGEEKPLLKPIRDGKLHDLTALSEGTADQLFLALRIAAIEEHAAASEPLPLVLDDLFASFDEVRTEAGLSLLADLGRTTTQVILFTHHEHVVEGARRTLGERVDVVRL